MYFDEDLRFLVEHGKMSTGNNWGTGMILVDPTTRKIALCKRNDTHQWCTPGGKVERTESPLQGVLRETKEESNVEVRSAIFYSYEMHVAENGKNWTSFMFLSTDFDASAMNPQETEFEQGCNWVWVPVQDALQLDLFPPTRKSLERAVEMGLLDWATDPVWQDAQISAVYQNYIGFVDCPKNASQASDSCCCAYSYLGEGTWGGAFDTGYPIGCTGCC